LRCRSTLCLRAMPQNRWVWSTSCRGAKLLSRCVSSQRDGVFDAQCRLINRFP
jgi:hypothetical protein